MFSLDLKENEVQPDYPIKSLYLPRNKTEKALSPTLPELVLKMTIIDLNDNNYKSSENTLSKSPFRPTILSVHPSVRASVTNIFLLKSPWDRPPTQQG